ncbi:MAG: class I SAM-dependent methyltransferase [Bacteroidia bacterium]|nr:class I SAM-dependent methyltransferase [Bacteroidia bacterium]
MNEENKKKVIQTFWEKQDHPNHSKQHEGEIWFRRFYDEIEFLLKDCKKGSILDMGFGSGDFLKYMSADYERVVGFDFSPAMCEKAKQLAEQLQLSNVTIYNGNVVNVDEVVKGEKFDCIVSFGVFQYITAAEAKISIEKASKLLKENGCIYILGIPDANMKVMHDIGVFHFAKNTKFSFRGMMKAILRLKYHEVKNSKQLKPKIDSFGYWHWRAEYREIADSLGLKYQIVNSIYEPYGYRFNIKLWN